MSTTTGPEQVPPGARGGGSGAGVHRDEAAYQDLKDRISADSLTTRRDYLRIMATVSGGLAVGGTAVSSGLFHRHGDGSAPPLKVADSLEPGQAVTFNYPDQHDRAMAIRLPGPGGRVVGYSTVCTHLACGVLWRSDRGEAGELLCPCHDGVFHPETGEVKAGPPPRALPKVLMEEREDGIWAVGTAKSGEPAPAAGEGRA